MKDLEDRLNSMNNKVDEKIDDQIDLILEKLCKEVETPRVWEPRELHQNLWDSIQR